jgi:hypothetical protein
MICVGWHAWAAYGKCGLDCGYVVQVLNTGKKFR